MKKWIIFLSISCALLIFVFGVQVEALLRFAKSANELKVIVHLSNGQILEIYESSIPYLICVCISLFFVLCLLVSNIFLLVTIAMRKVTPLSVKENLAAWKEHSEEKKVVRKQRKLEKAQAKVARLQDEMQKDDE